MPPAVHLYNSSSCSPNGSSGSSRRFRVNDGSAVPFCIWSRTSSNGVLMNVSRSSLQSRAVLWNPHPGNQLGRCLTVGIHKRGLQAESRCTREENLRAGMLSTRNLFGVMTSARLFMTSSARPTSGSLSSLTSWPYVILSRAAAAVLQYHHFVRVNRIIQSKEGLQAKVRGYA